MARHMAQYIGALDKELPPFENVPFRNALIAELASGYQSALVMRQAPTPVPVPPKSSLPN